ncbi:MAG TPA: SBBP repeat-containing protein, partial [Blastocatellia bacterium]|nr:SBBP repeat-containing protein [Blastocatellia bacterium]
MKTLKPASLYLFIFGFSLFASLVFYRYWNQPKTPMPVSAPAAASMRREAFGKLPLYFVENRGQTDARAAYYVQGSDKAIYFTDRGLTFVLNGGRKEPSLQPASFDSQSAIRNPQSERWALKLDFVGARTDAHPEGDAPTEAVVSYFKGNPSEWKTGLKTYSRIIYRDLWPGIDLIYDGTVNRMKYSFVVRPGADPNQIRLAYRGASGVTVNGEGELEVQTPAGGFNDARPVSFQEVDGKQIEVTTEYRLPGESAIHNPQSAIEYGFTLGDYDRSRELVIDPVVLIYAGFIGGSGDDFGESIAVDATGNAYVTGGTASTQATFPDGDGFGAVPGADTTHNGGSFDAFVAKINAAGTALVYAGYIGGSGSDFGIGVAVDDSGSAYVTGQTLSSQATFPVVTGPDLTINGLQDAFVAKLTPAGTGLNFCGYIGGSGGESGLAVAVDVIGNAYISGRTNSTEATFPTGSGFGAIPGADKTANGSFDAFVVKVHFSGTTLSYATYVGGSGSEQSSGINGLALDNFGNVYLAGDTASTEATFPDGDGFGPIVGFDQTYNGSVRDAFVVKLNSTGTAFVYATYLGGSGDDKGFGVAVDGAGSAYIAGSTDSTQATFPDGDGFGTVTGPDLTHNGSQDAFVAKLDPAGTALVYAGYIGGVLSDEAFSIGIDQNLNAYLTGYTSSSEATFPDGDGFGAIPSFDATFNGGADDAFVVKVNSGGTALSYAGYIGGSTGEQGVSIAVDQAGNAYVTGFTGSTQSTFPDGDGFGAIPGLDTTYNGGADDAFVAKISGNIVVNSSADTVAADGFCTLREAIQAANTNAAVNECRAGQAGLDTIEFSLPGNSATISPTSALPTITEPIYINGNTGGATRVELNGTAAGSAHGLNIQGGGSTISSLVINRFSMSGIFITSGTGNIVQDCYLGTDVTGLVDLGNGIDGINANSGGNVIGGKLPGEGNVLSGNGRAGITFGFGSSANVVQGNTIGLAANRNAALGNSQHGVFIDGGASNNTIGGTTISARNLISGNTQCGVNINQNSSVNNVVQGNFIGTGTEGEAFGNGDGVCLNSANNTIGGTVTGAGNLIAFNTGVGVNVAGTSTSTGNRVLGNFIFGNGQLGINLGSAGVSVNPNDAGDSDVGPNGFQNFPVLTSASLAGNSTVIQGTLNSAANASFRLEFFTNNACDVSGNGEGQAFLGFTNVTTNGSGNASFAVTLPIPVTIGQSVTATATDSLNSTSEFSACLAVNCNYQLGSAAVSVVPAGGSGTVAVTATGGCAWTAVSNSPFITVTSGANGSGNGTVGYSVAPNGGITPRSGTITIAGNTFTISQTATGVLVYTDFTGGIPPDWTVEHFGTGTYPDGTAATWTAANPCNRVVPAPFSGMFAIVDATCATPSATFDERLIPPAFDAGGLGSVYVEFFNRYLGAGAPDNVGDVDVSTDGGDSWPFNALRLRDVNDGSPTPNTKSLNITPLIAGNPTNVRVRHRYTGVGIQPSFRPNRPDAQELSWGIDYAIYHYELTPTSQNFSAAGGTSNVVVATSAIVPSPQGSWTVVSNAPWIVPAHGGSTGNGSIGYMVTANPSSSPRTGTMTIAGKTFTVMQSGCVGATINPATLPNGFVGVAYSQMLTATGGTAPYSFGVTAGTLPNGLTLSAAGLLSGTPNATGTFTFTVSVTDEIGCIGTRQYTVVISGNGLQFYPLPQPVRLLETRAGFTGCTTPGAPINAGGTFTLPARTTCAGIPASAQAVTGNVTVVPTGGGFLTLYPSSAQQPTVSNSNFGPGEVTNNVFTVGLGVADGAFKIFASGTTHVIVD